jgi:hypothetical protein
MSRMQKENCLSTGAVNCLTKGITYTDVVAFAKTICSEVYQKGKVA